MEDDRPSQPQDLRILDLFFNQIEQNALIEADKETLDIRLKIPRLSCSSFCGLTNISFQITDGLMGAFAFPAGIGLIYEFRFEDRLEIPDQDMVDDPIPEISGEDLAWLRFCNHEADRLAGLVGMADKFFL